MKVANITAVSRPCVLFESAINFDLGLGHTVIQMRG